MEKRSMQLEILSAQLDATLANVSKLKEDLDFVMFEAFESLRNTTVIEGIKPLQKALEKANRQLSRISDCISMWRG